jgi:hypothetical protein
METGGFLVNRKSAKNNWYLKNPRTLLANWTEIREQPTCEKIRELVTIQFTIAAGRGNRID